MYHFSYFYFMTPESTNLSYGIISTKYSQADSKANKHSSGNWFQISKSLFPNWQAIESLKDYSTILATASDSWKYDKANEFY